MAQYPQVNGAVYAFCSIQVQFSGLTQAPNVGIQAVSYKSSLKPGTIRGASARKIARTRGVHEPSASMSLYKLDADELIEALGDGYGEVPFDIHIDFAEDGMPITSVDIVAARIAEDNEDNKEGEDATLTSFDLDVMDILKNGFSITRRINRFNVF